MFSYFEASVSQLSIHKAGNKLLDETLSLSGHSLKVDDEVLDGLLMQYFLSPFEKLNEIYRLYHPIEDSNLNEAFHFAEMIIKGICFS